MFGNIINMTLFIFRFGKNVKIVHFIGALKPWHAAFNTATGQVESHAQTYHHQEYLQLWWNVFMDKVNPALGPEMVRNLDIR
jgi:glycogenin glucosyltransferase